MTSHTLLMICHQTLNVNKRTATVHMNNQVGPWDLGFLTGFLHVPWELCILRLIGLYWQLTIH